MKILIVDDSMPVRESYKMILRDRHQIFTAEDRIIGFLMFKDKGPFDLIISGIRSPGPKAVSFLGAIKVSNPYQKILLVTASPRDAEAEEIGRMGIPIIEKPFGVKEFLEEIERMIPMP